VQELDDLKETFEEMCCLQYRLGLSHGIAIGLIVGMLVAWAITTELMR
jgi:hypothetical protein